MGFDNDCIVNLQSLPGEYFCPVCRTLVYPNEALQSQCTHLYCKPCLAYIVSSTQACPYDGYLVTVADSRPLVESNKLLADTIGKVAVRCLYCRSGCQWQGALSDCITHCTDCNFGNSPVICNRCTTQVLHRQVQDHGQTCPGMQAQAQQVEGQTQDSKTEGQPVAQDQPLAVSAAPATAAASTAPSATAIATSASVPSTTAAVAASVQGQPQVNAVANPPTAVLAPPPEQWYQQQQLQYQQYYQQFPGYDPYQQQYQQYAQYQQQIHPQYAQMQAVPQQVIQGYQQPAPGMMQQLRPQHHPQPQTQPQPQPQPLPQLQPQPQPQPQPQAQAQPQARPVSQPQQIQVAQPQFHHQYPPQSQPQSQLQIQAHTQQLHAPVQQPDLQAQAQTHLPPHAQLAGQQPLQPPPHPRHPQPQPHHQLQPSNLQAPPPQPPHSQVQHPQSHVQQQALTQSHPQPQHQLPQSQSQPNPTPQRQPFPHPRPQHPSAQAIPGQQYYPQPQPVQQPPSIPQQRPMQVHPQHPIQVQNQFPTQQMSQMHPPHPQPPTQASQQPATMAPQHPHANLLPNQQQAQHAVHQHGQHILQHPSMQPHAQQQGLPQQQGYAQLHHGQPQQQGTYPSHPLTHPQQPLRAQGPPYMQQQGPVQPHLQKNVMSALPNHQVQNIPGRPMMPNSGMPQQPYNQSLVTSTMPKQVHVNQQAPNQNYPASATTHLPSSSDLQHGSVQQNQLAHPGSQQSTSLSAPPALQSGIHTNTSDNALIKQTESAEPKSLQFGNDSKYAENVEAPVADANVEIMPNNDGKNNRESAEKAPEKDLQLQVKDENVKEPVLKPLVEVEASESITVGSDIPDTSKAAAESKGLQNPGEPSGLGERMDQHQSPDATAGAQPRLDSNMVVKTEPLGSVADKSNANSVSQGQISENIAENMHAQHPNHQYELHKPPEPDQGGYTMQHSSNGHAPKMPNPELVPQRPPAPDKMFTQHMSNPDPHQERNFVHPPNHQIQVHGQLLAPTQYRPPVGNFSATFPHQGQPSISQEPFQPPMGKPPHGPYRSEMPSSTMVPGPFGLPEEQTQNQIPPSHAVGPRKFQGEPLGPPSMGGPLPGPRGPAFGIGDQVGRPANSMEAEGYAVKGADFNGWQRECHHPISIEHVPFGQPHVVRSNPMTMNGTHGVMGGVHDSDLLKARFAPVPDERFKPFPEHGAKARPEERFGPSTMNPATRIVSQFEEDLKRFPRPAHLDRAGMNDGYMSSKRPLDRLPQPFGLDAVQRPLDRFPYMTDADSTLTPLSSYNSGGRFPPNTSGSTVNPMDIGDRLRPVGPHEDSGRDHEISSGHPNHRMDCLPPLRNPGGEYTGIRAGRFGLDNQSHMDDFGSRVLHGFGDRSKAFNLPSDFVGRSLPSVLRAGDSVGQGQLHDGGTTGFSGIHSHLRAGDPSAGPGNLRSHMRIGEQIGVGNLTGRLDAQPGYGGRYDFPDGTKHSDSVFSHDGMNSFEHARMRKPGSMGWCRICKIDCETVEDLDLHSQTREHQNMSMDMVLSIKRESAKKQKLTSGGILSHEDASKVRKMNFESRANRM